MDVFGLGAVSLTRFSLNHSVLYRRLYLVVVVEDKFAKSKLTINFVLALHSFPCSHTRTGCRFDENGQGSCLAGDCAGRGLECGEQIMGWANLAEVNFNPDNSRVDWYDVSAVPRVLIPFGSSAMEFGRRKQARPDGLLDTF